MASKTFFHLSLPSDTKSILFGAVQLVPSPNAEGTVELQPGPRKEMTVNHLRYWCSES